MPECFRKHIENVLKPVIDEALKQAKVDIKEIDGDCCNLWTCDCRSAISRLSAGKALGFALDKPLLGVNHLEGHVFANFLAIARAGRLLWP